MHFISRVVEESLMYNSTKIFVQYVRVGGSASEVAIRNTGAPQGTVLAQLLFALYTSDFHFNSGSCHHQKFTDDSPVGVDLQIVTIKNHHYPESKYLVHIFVQQHDICHVSF